MRLETPEGVLEQVAEYLDPISVEALRARLLAAGLSPVIYNSTSDAGIVGLAGVRLLVPESQLAEAERIRDQLEAGEFAIDEDFDVGS